MEPIPNRSERPAQLRFMDKNSPLLPLPVPPLVTRLTLSELLGGQSLDALERDPHADGPSAAS
ncbi:hypothetical protein [Methylococcus sp. EFPC2]|uniref:hypothetical protein n=1 Tax=Methylococcus sp. EFPC2 TaxID=2812648 RepID=UPI001967E57F|nr:hypothetical protein [Methylococcus sp. EFPC2]QSA99345.1 hypothetical protein JWZ97_19815 [Methylococcus sp. EFPC2]